jgi:hypothetical protein
MSNRYFKTTFTAVYRHIALPVGLTALLAAGYFVLLRLLA